MTLKEQFLSAVVAGKLGSRDPQGETIVTLQEFKHYFAEVKPSYSGIFLSGSVIETGQYTPTHSRFVFRIAKGVYKIHPAALN